MRCKNAPKEAISEQKRKDIGEELVSRANLLGEVAEQGLPGDGHGGT
jgi:hypothetical protein